jgi:putative transcriptional regulator
MGERNNMRIQDVCNITGLRRNTVAALYNDRATRIDTITIAALCVALNCTVGDLFVLSGSDL